MTRYLLDTNVVLRLCNPLDQRHRLATEAVATLLRQSDECFLAPQVMIELWVVATRPVEVNGLGWSAAQTAQTIDQLLGLFPLIKEVPAVFTYWLSLVHGNAVRGKRAHDARIVAVMLAAGIEAILTFNTADFVGISNIKVIHPRDIFDQT